MEYIHFEWDELKNNLNYQKHNIDFMEGKKMRDNYDFSNSKKNPYVKKLKKQISIRIDTNTIKYFKELSEEIGIPYQKLMNNYLTDCTRKNIKPQLKWEKQNV